MKYERVNKEPTIKALDDDGRTVMYFMAHTLEEVDGENVVILATSPDGRYRGWDHYLDGHNTINEALRYIESKVDEWSSREDMMTDIRGH